MKIITFTTTAQLEPNSSPVSLINVSYPAMTDMEILESLDDEALEEIIRTNSMMHHSDNEAQSAQGSNCTETVWNVTLVPRELRKNHTYVLVSS